MAGVSVCLCMLRERQIWLHNSKQAADYIHVPDFLENVQTKVSTKKTNNLYSITFPSIFRLLSFICLVIK